jgi:hypothetical protein
VAPCGIARSKRCGRRACRWGDGKSHPDPSSARRQASVSVE